MARTPRLNQHLANENQIKNETDKTITMLYHIAQKPDLFSGLEKFYSSLADEGGDKLPPETKKVQVVAENVLKDGATLWSRYFDYTATKDTANANAKADVVVGETILLKDMPVTTLLFLEKQLENVRTLVTHLPVLDGADNWEKDEATGHHKTKEVQTHRTKKVQKPIVKYPHSDKHPAQTEMITEDIVEGYWHTKKFSGAMTYPRKRAILDRVSLLLQAVKTAREGANGATEAPKVEVGDAIFGYLFHE